MRSMKYTHDWFPTEELPPDEGVYIDVWLYLGKGLIIAGRFIYSLDEASANYAGLWLDKDSMAEVYPLYWKIRRESDSIPDPPQ